MAIVDSLLYRGPDPHAEGDLPAEELLRRVAARFPLAVIDRDRGDRMARDHVASLAEVSAHAVVLDDWRALAGRVAYVTVRGEAGGPQFGFFLRPNPGLIDIDYDGPAGRAACRPLLEALAADIEYDILTEDMEE